MESFYQILSLQNNLLANQIKLLEQINNPKAPQNQIVPRQENIIDSPRGEFVRNLNRDEMRNGFLVTSYRKKLWNVQIGLINEFARVCKKYNLRWFAYGGTLLGAARHGGYIPWDDDVDILMFRPDYNKLVRVAANEFKYPYFFDNWYNYRRETDEEVEPPNPNLPLITKSTEQKHPNSYPFLGWSKVIDLRTTMVEEFDRNDRIQSIWIDIFPFDNVPPFTEEKNKLNFGILRELTIATFHPEIIRNEIEKNSRFLLSLDDLKNFLKLPYRQRGIQMENFAEKIFFESEKTSKMFDYLLTINTKNTFPLKHFEKTVYLPFEEIELPAPAGWEDCLTSQYGDWRKMIIWPSHTLEYSVDIPYAEYYRNSARMK